LKADLKHCPDPKYRFSFDEVISFANRVNAAYFEVSQENQSLDFVFSILYNRLNGRISIHGTADELFLAAKQPNQNVIYVKYGLLEVRRFPLAIGNLSTIGELLSAIDFTTGSVCTRLVLDGETLYDPNLRLSDCGIVPGVIVTALDI